MTSRKRWPNEADNARTDAIAQARSILMQAGPMKDALEAGKAVSSLELSIRLSRMSDAANNIIKKLSEFDERKFID